MSRKIDALFLTLGSLISAGIPGDAAAFRFLEIEALLSVAESLDRISKRLAEIAPNNGTERDMGTR